MDEVKNDYIDKALNELISFFGTRDFIDHTKLIALIEAKKVKECIKEIAQYLGLPIEVNLSYVPTGYRPSATDGFQSTHLVKTDQHNRGTGGITAQVSIPSNLPLYGTPRMVNFPISVRLSEDCAENPATLISIVAHELSHIVLHSAWHKEKENEYYTDLTAMLLGFAKIMEIGRKVVKVRTSTDNWVVYRKTTTHTNTTTYGYLSDGNFDFAFNKIKNSLHKQGSAKEELIRKVRQFESQLNEAKKLPLYFTKYLEQVDKDLNQKISKEDGQKISGFHQLGYTDTFLSVVKKNETTSKNLLRSVESIKIHNTRSAETIRQYQTQLESAEEEIAGPRLSLQEDINVLKKYVGFVFKVKLNFIEKVSSARSAFKRYLPLQSKEKIYTAHHAISRKKFRFSKNAKGWMAAIIGLVILAFILNHKNSSEPLPSQAPLSTVNTVTGASGQIYDCSDTNYNQATALEPDPTTVASLKTESIELDSRHAVLNTESAQIDAMYVDQSDQTSLDAYNSAVDDYNTKLNQLKADDASWNQENDALNRQIDTYNNFLSANCTPA